MEGEKTTVEHLTDLRKVLISSAIFFGVIFILFLVFIHFILDFMTQSYQLVMLGPLDVIRLYMKIAGSLSIGFSIPFIGYQLWKFIRPALSTKESKVSLRFIPALLLSFIAGTLFGFFIIFPVAFNFLMNLGGSNFEMLVTANKYFSFLLLTTIPFGILFEIPIVALFLTSMGIVTPKQLKHIRKYVYITLAIVSAIVTPPDFVIQLSVMGPLFGLYELGILLSGLIYKRKMKKMNAS